VQSFLGSAGLNDFNVVVANRKVMSVEAHFGGTAGADIGAGLQAPNGVTASIWMTRKPDTRRRLREQTGHTCPSGPACSANAAAVIALTGTVGDCSGSADVCGTGSLSGKACTWKTEANGAAGQICEDSATYAGNCMSNAASDWSCCDKPAGWTAPACNAAADVKAVRDRLFELGYSYVGVPAQACVYSTLQSCAETTWSAPGSSSCGTNCMNFLKRAIRIFTCVTGGHSKLGNNPSNGNTWGDLGALCGSATMEPGSKASKWLASPNAPAWVQLTARSTTAGCGYTAKSSGGDLCNAQVGLNTLSHAGHDWKLAEESWDAHKWGTSWAHSIF
jgi:hypothetical protein